MNAAAPEPAAAPLEPDRVAAIQGLLAAAAREERVALLWAVESGSRAWGFPSPDSDYDCRFLFVRPAADYLTPWPRRDVIETPLVDDLDVNGWELGKALRLLLNGNAVVDEWLRAPLLYRGESELRDDLLGLAARHGRRDRIARHYLHLGERQRRAHFGEGRSVKLKKLFYALRPAAALRCLRRHPDASVAPMHFPTLMAQCKPPAEVAALVEELIRRKAVTHELGEAPAPAVVLDFVDREFDAARQAFSGPIPPLAPEARAEAESIFRKWVERGTGMIGQGA